MVRPRLSCGLRAQLAAVGGFSPQVVSSSVVAAWSAFGHASVVTGALAVSMLHSRRGLRPRRGERRRRRRSPRRGRCKSVGCRNLRGVRRDPGGGLVA